MSPPPLIFTRGQIIVHDIVCVLHRFGLPFFQLLKQIVAAIQCYCLTFLNQLLRITSSFAARFWHIVGM